MNMITTGGGGLLRWESLPPQVHLAFEVLPYFSNKNFFTAT
jgi:hypothetical protein